MTGRALVVQPKQEPVAISQMLFRAMPASVQHTCTPLQILIRVYGIEPGWHCTGCGRPYELDDLVRKTGNDGKPCYGACPGCRKPLPRRCATKGCAGLVDPLPGHGRRGSSTTLWYDGPPHCTTCDQNVVARTRATTMAARIPSMAMTAALSWLPDTPWRRTLSAIASTWAQGSRNVACLYIHGPVGTGKSVAAAFVVRRAYTALGDAADFVWCTERQLLDAHRDRFDSGDAAWIKERASRAVDLIHGAKYKPMLVIDELWSGGAGGYTDKQVELVWDILSHRLDNRLLTILVSNTPYLPDESDLLNTVWHFGLGHGADRQRGEAMASRFSLVGEEVEANGRDRRRVKYRGDEGATTT